MLCTARKSYLLCTEHMHVFVGLLQKRLIILVHCQRTVHAQQMTATLAHNAISLPRWRLGDLSMSQLPALVGCKLINIRKLLDRCRTLFWEPVPALLVQKPFRKGKGFHQNAVSAYRHDKGQD